MNLTEFINNLKSAKDPELYLRTLPYRDYISILDKQQLLFFMINDSSYSTPEMEVIDLNTKEFFHVLLRYLFVEVQPEEMDEVNVENYDYLVPLVRSYILSFARDDYEEFKGIIRDTFTLYAFSNISDSLEALDQEAIAEGITNNAEIIGELKKNKELIHELSSIAAFNNPLTHEMIKDHIK